MPEEIMGGAHRICVIGLGHVGLPLALLLASQGAKVEGCEANGEYLSKLRAGICPIVEHSGSQMAKTVLQESCPNCGVRLLREGDESFCPNCLKVVDLSSGMRVTGLTHGVAAGSGGNEMQAILREVQPTGRLVLSSDARAATARAEITIICVGTPISERKEPDLSALISASKEVGRGLRAGSLVVLKSTVSPGTTENIVRPILEGKSGLRAGRDFGLAHVPETTLEGLALLGYKTLPKTVGGIDDRSAELAAAVFRVFDAPVYTFKSPRVTEAAKLFQNIYRDVNVALANELAMASEKLDIDVTQVIEAALTEPKTHLLTPGPGVGGYCLPKDGFYLTSPAVRRGFKPSLIATARKVNDEMPRHVASLVKGALKEKKIRVAGSRAAILGLSFKANTADTRDSPSLRVVDLLAKAGMKLSVHDPLVDLASLPLPRNVDLRTHDFREVLKGADVLVLLTDHLEYRSISLSDLKRHRSTLKAIVDARHIFDPTQARNLGFCYRGVGRSAS